MLCNFTGFPVLSTSASPSHLPPSLPPQCQRPFSPSLPPIVYTSPLLTLTLFPSTTALGSPPSPSLT